MHHTSYWKPGWALSSMQSQCVQFNLKLWGVVACRSYIAAIRYQSMYLDNRNPDGCHYHRSYGMCRDNQRVGNNLQILDVLLEWLHLQQDRASGEVLLELHRSVVAFYIPFWLHKQKPANFGLLSQRPGRFAMIKTGNFLGAINEDFDSFEIWGIKREYCGAFPR